MQYALVNGQRTAPSPGLIGSCPACKSPMIAKCGNVRIHHWAHRGERVCDPWWGRETAWHRDWKNNFPSHWQEVARLASCGERHIADVHSDHGLTIEFQHSHLRLGERIVRESFYGNMVWAVNGARLKHDAPRFLEAARSFHTFMQKGLYLTPSPERAFPQAWLDCSVPVFFDFASSEVSTEEFLRASRPLWCLLPGRVFGLAVVLRISRDSFVWLGHTRAQLINTGAILDTVARELSLLAERQRRVQLAQVRAAKLQMRKPVKRYPPTYRKRRFRRF